MKTIAAALILTALAAPALAEQLTTYDAVRTGLLAVWQDMPLSFRNVTLTAAPVASFGNYTKAESAAYKAGEIIHVYAEALGYGWKPNPDGTSSVALDVDLALKTPAGKLVASEDGFLKTDIRSRSQNFETFLTLDVTLHDFAPGAYVLAYTVHDEASGKTGNFEIPVTLEP